MCELNKDVETRDKIIFGRYRASAYKFNGKRRFEHMTHSQMVELLNKQFADPDSYVGNSPTFKQVCDFIEKYPVYMANGYAMAFDGEGYGVFVDGVDCGEPAASCEEFQDYMELFGNSDVFDEATMYCLFTE